MSLKRNKKYTNCAENATGSVNGGKHLFGFHWLEIHKFYEFVDITLEKESKCSILDYLDINQAELWNYKGQYYSI